MNPFEELQAKTQLVDQQIVSLQQDVKSLDDEITETEQELQSILRQKGALEEGKLKEEKLLQNLKLSLNELHAELAWQKELEVIIATQIQLLIKNFEMESKAFAHHSAIIHQGCLDNLQVLISHDKMDLPYNVQYLVQRLESLKNNRKEVLQIQNALWEQEKSDILLQTLPLESSDDNNFNNSISSTHDNATSGKLSTSATIINLVEKDQSLEQFYEIDSDVEPPSSNVNRIASQSMRNVPWYREIRKRRLFELDGHV